MRRGIDSMEFTIYAPPREEYINAKMCERETRGENDGEGEIY